MCNFILTNVSTLRADSTEVTYSDGNGHQVTGIQTNEAPIKYLLQQIDRAGRAQDDDPCTIIAITTPQAESAYHNLQEVTDAYCAANQFPAVIYEKMEYKDRNFASIIAKVVSLVHAGDALWIDSTGGFRDTIYLLMFVVRMLEYSGAKLKRAIYSEYRQAQNDKVVKGMISLDSATKTILDADDPEELEAYYQDHTDPDVKYAIDQMHQLLAELAPCRTHKTGDCQKALHESLGPLKNRQWAGSWTSQAPTVCST